jgi:Protein of unknown function (DUF2789)
MNAPHHPFRELFLQLGLADSPQAIASFLAAHAPLPESTRLEDAPFWTAAQSRLLREELVRDADWAVVIDQLNLALRSPPEPAGG